MTGAISHVMGRRGTYAALAAELPQPRRRLSQHEHRQRRYKGLPPGHYDGTWSLNSEIAEVVEPLARQISDDARPSRFLRTTPTVTWLAEVVHELVPEAVGMVAEADARRRPVHLASDPGARRSAMTMLCDIAPRPALPEITEKMLADGSWAAALTAMAETVDSQLCDLLACSHPPGAPALRGQPSRSDLLARLLARTLDRAAMALQRRLDRDSNGNGHPAADTEYDCARVKLAALGIDTEETP